MLLASKEQLTDYACSILIDAYEGGSHGLASWAVCYGTYRWASEKGEYKLGDRLIYASVVLYDLEDCELKEEEGKEGTGFYNWYGWWQFGKPLPIDDKKIAEFIVKVGSGEYDTKAVPEYARLSDSTLKGLLMMYHGFDDPFSEWDCMNADQVIQTILLGEVTYG